MDIEVEYHKFPKRGRSFMLGRFLSELHRMRRQHPMLFLHDMYDVYQEVDGLYARLTYYREEDRMILHGVFDRRRRAQEALDLFDLLTVKYISLDTGPYHDGSEYQQPKFDGDVKKADDSLHEFLEFVSTEPVKRIGGKVLRENFDRKVNHARNHLGEADRFWARATDGVDSRFHWAVHYTEAALDTFHVLVRDYADQVLVPLQIWTGPHPRSRSAVAAARATKSRP